MAGAQADWLQKELQKAANQLIRRYYSKLPGPRPKVSLSNRLTETAGKYWPSTHEIVIAAKFHRDRGMEWTLRVLKHELAHWAAYRIHGKHIRAHGPEWAAEAKRLDPKIEKLAPPFAFRERRGR